MATRAYFDWVRAGRQWSPATPIGDFAKTMRGHGYTVYILGADDPSHLQSNFPEDHCPFSQTPWPGAQPYPRVLALDIMPGGQMDWRAVGEKIVADRNAGRPGTEWIKYMNYTDRAGNVYHASWQPGYSRRASSDGGHIHISGRTDYVDAHTAYDPFGAPAPALIQQRGIGMIQVKNGPTIVLTDYMTWHRRLSFGELETMRVAGMVRVDIGAAEMNRILALPQDLAAVKASVMSDAQFADFKAAMLAAVPSKEGIADVLIARAAGK